MLDSRSLAVSCPAFACVNYTVSRKNPWILTSFEAVTTLVLKFFGKSFGVFNSRRRYFYFVEPIIATVMITSFTLIYNRVKQFMYQRLHGMERDLILQNVVFGLYQTLLSARGNMSSIPSEVLNLIRDVNKVDVNFSVNSVDDNLNLLSISARSNVPHEKNNTFAEIKSLMPKNEDFYDNHSLTIELSDETISPVI